MSHRRRTIIILIGIFLLYVTYKGLAVWTIQYGECKPKVVDPNLRLLTRDEHGRLVSFPERVG